MATHNNALPPLQRIKKRAKQLKKSEKISQSEAYKRLSEEYGFSSWNDFKAELEVAENRKKGIPAPSLNFESDDDVEMTDEDYEILDNERSTDLSTDQKKQFFENQRELTKLGIEFSIFEPTNTGLNKFILDATQPVRTHFELEEFHCYDKQEQGRENKIKKSAFLVSDGKAIKSTVSLYRPDTKNGDPRMWFSKLPEFCEAGDQIAILVMDDSLYLLNLSKVSLADSIKKIDSEINKLLQALLKDELSAADELLEELKLLAKKPLPALREGSTGVGYTIETMLGIAANSSKAPDYKGIEIKSGRGNKTRSTLFAQVPNWELSPCKRSSEILNKYGYERNDDFKLYCTVSTQKENSQGLSFIYDEKSDQLQEWHDKKDLVAVWPGELLRQRLREKHAETFWIHAESEDIDGVEHFNLRSVTYTRAPVLSRLLPLIDAGVITMDHLIKRSAKNNRVSEKGPLFKINKSDLDLLFPEPVTYSLENQG